MIKASSHAAKDAFRWQFLISAIQDLPLEKLKTQTLKRFFSRHGVGSGGWLIIAAGAVALLYWHGRLVFATVIGVVVMLLVYLMHDWKPSINAVEVRKLLQGWNQPFVVSVGAGAIATFSTYLAIAIWAESDSAWIASGAILQGMGTLIGLGLLMWQICNRQNPQAQIPINQLLFDLAHKDPLKRLLAVRQLTDSVSVLDDEYRLERRSQGANRPHNSAKIPSRRQIADYFRVMLQREEDPIIRAAVLDGLQTLEIVYQLQQATEPMIRVSQPRSPTRVRRVAPERLMR
ncbi:hypothetical protein JOY44_03990 [Phormidium sp. CLA17]|uniref:hypothetical protein n=1 Tax=Leptolyngbya sp. Cla-17 TaxID=2803751 RepID=UPI001491A942|nr:hypothetical protein [Leptolyngbya sp. Cla-17]MBM0740785.1 hypothetical protein [Leptolyngbya sp. Cla-17]